MNRIQVQRPNYSLRCKSKLIDLSRPKIMGVLNATPDSFYANSRIEGLDAAVEKALQMKAEGATFLDIGGYSSRPGANDVAPQEELDRVLPLVEKLLAADGDLLLSIDTFRSEIAEACLRAGAALINDISAGDADPLMLEVLVRHQAPYVAMHKQGIPKSMQDQPEYQEVVADVFRYLDKKVSDLRKAGVKDIIIDPGFGFGKTTAHNFALLGRLAEFHRLQHPILVGISRKSMVYKNLNTSPEESLNGSTALHVVALERGAHILRVHDVRAAQECIELHHLTQIYGS